MRPALAPALSLLKDLLRTGRTLPLLAVGGALGWLIWLGAEWPALALGLAAVTALSAALFFNRRIRALADQFAAVAQIDAGGSPWHRLALAAAELEERVRILDDRLDQKHNVTGLPTREPLLARMQADRTGTLGVIAFVDFDRLCAFDPAFADRALEQFAQRIVRMIGQDRMFAHIDRSHFALWFGPHIGFEDAEKQLQAISYALSDVITDEGRDLVPDLRVNHARFDGGAEAPHEVLARMLAASSAAGTGAAQVQRVDESSASAERDRYLFEQDLRQAVQNNEFELRFQPQIDAANGRLMGAEALLRWNSPGRGMVSPTVFVPILESAGIIDEAGMWALNAACREARLWQTLQLGSLNIAVNVSGYQLDKEGVDQAIERTLERHLLPPRALEIELTESIAAADVARTGRLFDGLRKQGVRIAIDDFGTGFSSFSSLRALAFDKIKIDREFVTDVERRRDSQAICQSIIALGRGLGIRVLAEGVERHEEYLWLRQHGCWEFQGFYFAKPLTGTEFQSFARDTAKLNALLALDVRQIQQTLAQRLAK